MSVLSCEGPAPNISMISGCSSPGEPLFMDINTIQKYFKQYKKTWKHFYINCVNQRIENGSVGNCVRRFPFGYLAFSILKAAYAWNFEMTFFEL